MKIYNVFVIRRTKAKAKKKKTNRGECKEKDVVAGNEKSLAPPPHDDGPGERDRAVLQLQCRRGYVRDACDA